MHVLLVGLAIALAVYLLVVLTLILAGRRGAAREAALLLPNLARLFKDLIRDPRVPRRSKGLLALGAAWIASPIDLIPEFIPFLGPLDDAVVAALILRRLVRWAGREVVLEHWHRDPATMARLLRAVEPRAVRRGGSWLGWASLGRWVIGLAVGRVGTERKSHLR